MKLIFQAIGLAVVLFLYGFLLSSAGHDHSTHHNSGIKTAVGLSDHDTQSHSGNGHDHH
ncbi:MAG: hypothetical protein AB7S78_13260 [Candidatus Omnitrophota bacterium]